MIRRFLRRMAVLLVIGIVNRICFGPDILMNYAVLGAVLVLFRNASDRVLVIAAILGLAIPELWQAVAAGIGYHPTPSPVSRAERLRLATDGPWLDLVRLRAQRLAIWWNELLSEGAYLTLFLLGLWAARRRLFDQPEAHKRLWRTLCLGGFALTLLGYLAQSALRPGLSGGESWIAFAFALVWPATTFVQGAQHSSCSGSLRSPGAAGG